MIISINNSVDFEKAILENETSFILLTVKWTHDSNIARVKLNDLVLSKFEWVI